MGSLAGLHAGLCCAAWEGLDLAGRPGPSEHRGTQADLPKATSGPWPPLPQPLQGTASAWNFYPSVPIRWQDSLLSSTEERRPPHKAHAPCMLPLTQCHSRSVSKLVCQGNNPCIYSVAIRLAG